MMEDQAKSRQSFSRGGLIVIAGVLLLAAATLYTFRLVTDLGPPVEELYSEGRLIVAALDEYKGTHGQYPDDIGDIAAHPTLKSASLSRWRYDSTSDGMALYAGPRDRTVVYRTGQGWYVTSDQPNVPTRHLEEEPRGR